MKTITEFKIKDTTLFTETGSASVVQYTRDQPHVVLPANMSIVYAGAPTPEAIAMLAADGVYIHMERINNVGNQAPLGDAPVPIPNTYLVYVADARYIVVYRVATWMQVLMNHQAMIRNGKDSASRVADLLEDPMRVQEFFTDLLGSERLAAACGDATMDLDHAARIATYDYDIGNDDCWNMSVVYAAYMYVRIFGESKVTNA